MMTEGEALAAAAARADRIARLEHRIEQLLHDRQVPLRSRALWGAMYETMAHDEPDLERIAGRLERARQRGLGQFAVSRG